MTFFHFLSAGAQVLLVVGAAFVVLTLLVSYFRFQFTTYRTVQEQPEAAAPEDVLCFKLIERLGTAHRAPEPFCLMLAGIGDVAGLVRQDGPEAGREVLEHVRGLIAAGLRRTDTVCVYRDEVVAAVVDAPRAVAERIAQRVVAALADKACACGSGQVFHPAAHVGVATSPENGDRAKALIEQAEAALVKAVAAGQPGHWIAEPAAGAPAPAAAEAAVPDQHALVDPLTGVLRPERLGTALQKFAARYRKDGKPVSILYVDVDYLRRYNEHYGQEAGDAVLRGLGGLLEKAVREGDLIGRYGGEEFLIAMPCRPQDATIAAQRIVTAVKRAAFAFAQTQLRITASIGVAGYPDHGATPQQLFEAAGRALQAAKAGGRGRVMMYEAAMGPAGIRAQRVADKF